MIARVDDVGRWALGFAILHIRLWQLIEVGRVHVQVDHDPGFVVRHAGKLGADAAPHRARRTVATYQISRTVVLGALRRRLANRKTNTLAIVLQPGQATVQVHFHRRHGIDRRGDVAHRDEGRGVG